jgi:transposase
MRYGLMSNFRRSWSRVGTRSVLPQKQGYENSYLFTALQPLTGENFSLVSFDEMSTETELVFLQELKKQHPTQNICVVMDNAPCHKPKVLHILEGLSIIYLPPYSPELNPVERYFEEMRRATANQIFTTLEELETRLTTVINSWTNEMVKKLTCYDWIKEQLGGVN